MLESTRTLTLVSLFILPAKIGLKFEYHEHIRYKMVFILKKQNNTKVVCGGLKSLIKALCKASLLLELGLLRRWQSGQLHSAVNAAISVYAGSNPARRTT